MSPAAAETSGQRQRHRHRGLVSLPLLTEAFQFRVRAVSLPVTSVVLQHGAATTVVCYDDLSTSISKFSSAVIYLLIRRLITV